MYALRFTQTAVEEIDAAHAWMATTAGDRIADAWRDGLMETIRTLATLPEREPIAPENDLIPGVTVRQFLYRRRRRSVAYRVLFSVLGGGPGFHDAPAIRILHVRHGSARPMAAEDLSSEDTAA